MDFDCRGRKKASACESRAKRPRLFNKNPRITAREIVEEKSNSGVGVCRYTDGRVLETPLPNSL